MNKPIEGSLHLFSPAFLFRPEQRFWRWRIETRNFKVQSNFYGTLVDDAIIEAEETAKALGIKIVEKAPPEIQEK